MRLGCVRIVLVDVCLVIVLRDVCHVIVDFILMYLHILVKDARWFLLIVDNVPILYVWLVRYSIYFSMELASNVHH